jgi:hypothetical protein
MERTNIQLEKKLVEKARKVAELKFEHRNINSYAEALREIIIEFLNNNPELVQEYSKKLKSANQGTRTISAQGG